MTTILQLSDTHIAGRGKLVSGLLETDKFLERLVGHIHACRSRIGTIDAILVSGDISDDGTPESYERFKDIMSVLDEPIYVIPGNHDARETMRHAFGHHHYMPANGYLNWSGKINETLLMGLDTLNEGQGGGVLSRQTLAFLDGTLAKANGAPVLLALHHPPFQTGIKFMDDIGLENTADLSGVLKTYTGPLRIVCGHIHSLMISDVGKYTAISAPSSASSFAYDTRPNAVAGFNILPDGCLLHRWDQGFQTLRIGPGTGDGPHPF